MDKNRIIIIGILFNVLSCNYQEVNTDPHFPNIGITIKDLKNSGWELSIVDHGVCVYERKNSSPNLVFYLSDDDHCKKVRSQELFIQLQYPHKTGNGYEINTDSIVFIDKNKLLNEIDSLLNVYHSKRITNIKTINSCLFEFDSENREKFRVNWRLSLCSRDNWLTTHRDL